MNSSHLVSVLVPVALAGTYTYGSDRPLVPGTLVVVPLGPREVVGVVWNNEPGTVDPKKLKLVSRLPDCPRLPETMISFVDWVADYTLSPPGMVLRMVLRAPGALEPEAPIMGVRLQGPAPLRLTSARARVLEVAGNGLAWSKAGLADAAGVSSGVIQGLVKSGTLVPVELARRPVSVDPNPSFVQPALSDDQAGVAQALVDSVAAEQFAVSLVDGVTGSGKTEVYFEAIAQALKQSRQVLVLLPEIALTASFLERFASRFGAPPAEWHSEVGRKTRDRIWRGTLSGDVKVVAGARSALFLPFTDLGLIVVDEEHDPAFKQEDGVRYHARDMAVARAHESGFPIVLASATPSVESRVNGDRGRYKRLVLPSRFGSLEPPETLSVDLRKERPEPGHWISPPLVAAIDDTLIAGQQVLLFLNRRGFAPLTLCRACGHRISCQSCSAWLVEHRFRSVLACHHCGFEQPRPERCPNCKAADSLVPCGPGVERLQDEVLERWPGARTLILSSDMMGGVQRLRLELKAIADGEVDIVIGTQLVAKGHNFPALTLVGVVDADLGITGEDPRSGERAFQLLTQVSGRAGRAGNKSRALLQTHDPDHPIIQALLTSDRDGFYARESEIRRRGGLPPFGRLAAIIVSSPHRETAFDHARAMATAGPEADDVRLLGPAEAPMAVIRGRHRFRLLAQAGSSVRLHTWMRTWLGAAPRPRAKVRVAIDIDPQNFM